MAEASRCARQNAAEKKKMRMYALYHRALRTAASHKSKLVTCYLAHICAQHCVRSKRKPYRIAPKRLALASLSYLYIEKTRGSCGENLSPLEAIRDD